MTAVRFNEDNHRFFVHFNSYGFDMEVIPQEIKYEDGDSKKTEVYKLTFKSEVFGFRPYEENNHQKLCQIVLSRIPWKKIGFWIKEGKRFPIPILKRLKLKH